MNDVFISYSRRDKVFTQKLYEALTGASRTVWADWDSIPAASDWDAEIKQGIQETNSVLFVLSPEWIKSNECRKEMVHAVAMGKRLFPILYLPVDPNDIPPELAKINWVYLRDSDDFDKGFQTLCSAMDTDLDWIKTHTRIQVRAMEWDKKKRESSFVLRGNDLADGEKFISGAAHKSPEPTPLQGEYILASRKDAIRRQRQTLSGVTVALIVSVALGVVAFFQRQAAVAAEATAVVARDQAVVSRNTAISAGSTAVSAEGTAVSAKETAIANELEAKRQAKISRAGELAARSVAMRDKNFQLSMLLGIEAINTVDNSETRSVLLDNAQAHPQLIQYLGNVSESVRNIVFSQDGRMLVIGSDPILFWDVANNTPIEEPLDASGTIALSLDGKTLATGSFDGSVVLWDIATRKMNHQLMEAYSKYGYATYVSFSPDGKTLASARGESGNNNDVRLWDVATGKQIGQPLLPQSTAGEVSFSPYGNLLAAADGNYVHLFEAKTGLSLGILNGNVYAVTNVAFSPDGKTLATGSYDHMIVLWDVITRQSTARWSTGATDTIQDSITDLAFSPNGKIIASSNNAGDVFLWDVQTHNIIGDPLNGVSTAEVLGIAFAPDGKMLLSAYRNGSVAEWDMEPRLFSGRRLTDHTEWVTSVAFSPDGKIVASGGFDRSIILSDAVSGDPIGDPLITPSSVRALAFSPDGKMLAGSGCTEELNCAPGLIWLWDVAARKQTGQIDTGLDSYPAFLAFSSDGRMLLTHTYGSDDMDMLLWDVTTGKMIGQPLKGIYAFNPDGKLLATINTEGNGISFVEPGTGKAMANSLKGPDGVILGGLAFSSDGEYIASTYGSTNIIIWDVESGNILHDIFAGQNNANKVRFSPDGKMLASSGLQTVTLFNVESGGQIGEPLTGHTSYVNDLAFSPLGNVLATASNDKSVILWNLDQQSWFTNACERAGRNLTKAEWDYYFSGEEFHVTCEQWPAGQ